MPDVKCGQFYTNDGNLNKGMGQSIGNALVLNWTFLCTSEWQISILLREVKSQTVSNLFRAF